MQENTGNIISLTSILPDFTDQVGASPVTFNFPAVFPSGKTPEATFPFGTELCVDAKLSNPVGFDIELATDSGACLQPGFKKSSGITAVSEIAVSEWNQSQLWSSGTPNTDFHVSGPLTAMFDADPNNGTFVASTANSKVISLPTPVTFTDKVEVKGFLSDVYDPIFVNGQDVSSLFGQQGLGYKTSDVTAFIQASSNPTQLVDLQLHQTGGKSSNLAAIYIDGKRLVDTGIPGATTSTSNQLTFADATNLNAFEASDAVYMCDANGDAASYTPQTSTIASVGTLAYIGHKDVTNWLNAFDGNDNTYALYANVGSTLTFSTSSASAQMIIRNDSSATSQTVGVYLPDGTSAGSFASTGNNTLSPGTGTTVTDTFTFSSASSSYVLRQTAGSAQNIKVYSIESATTLLIFESPNPDLQYFKPGDQVGTASVFTPVLYTGDGDTKAITGVGFSPDLVWIKSKTDDRSHALADSVTGPNKRLSSDTTGAQVPDITVLTSFDPDGFTIGGGFEVGKAGEDYVAWNFKAAPGFMDIVEWDGDGTTKLIPHNLSSPVGFAITKVISTTGNWYCQHITQVEKGTTN